MPPQPGSRGEMLTSVSNEITRLKAECYGRGPERAKAYLNDDNLIVVMHGGLTTVEKTLLNGGNHELVRHVRLTFQAQMTEEFTGAVERCTGRRVLTYHSQIVFDPAVAFELFVLAPEDDPHDAAGDDAAA
jgi:uncharacterized protein YbcI